MVTPTAFDVIVLGGGTGRDIVLAAEARGLRVALIERGPLGRTCHNRGCMPTKMLIHAADLAEAVRRAPEFGVDARIDGVRLGALVERVFAQLDEETREREEALHASDLVRFYRAEARFVGPRTIEVGGEAITAPRIVIAAGSRPTLPSIPGIEGVPYLTSDDALHLHNLPKRLVIVGGGYIAAELAHLYGALGAEVTYVVRGPRLLEREDVEVAERFTHEQQARHRVLLNTDVERAERTSDGGVALVLAGGRRVAGDALLIATGRRPNGDGLGIEHTEVALGPDSRVLVNERFETSAPGLWAFGDVTAELPLKHVAVRQARLLIDGLFEDRWRALDYSRVPHAVFSSPQVAAVGATEEELQAAGTAYKVGRHELAHTGMGMALAEPGLAKILASPDNRILGCHIIGPDASVLIHEAVVAMTASGRLEAITDAVHAHPALSQLLEEAARAALLASVEAARGDS